jgi:hypothetical protein
MTIGISAKKWQVTAFDAVVKKLAAVHTSFTEEDALKADFWNRGEDARLREDFRFRKTPGGRWILSDRLLANNELYKLFFHKKKSVLKLQEAFNELGPSGNKSWTFCKADKRFVLEDDMVRLSESELSKKILTEEAAEVEKYSTHLPIHSLDAVAASEPAGEWGPNSQEEMVETLGWVKVSLPGQKLNDRMFVARIKGSSMDDGRSGLVDGSYGIFELWPVGTRQNKIVLVRGSFNDPETGSYVLKKYVADTRDEEGRHHRVALVSLNMNKEKYPDIVIDPEEDDSVTVIAQLVSALSGKKYARQPKPARIRGRRNLDVGFIENQMQKRIQALFENKAADRPICEKKYIPMRLICLDFESGGLHIETEPQTWLPNFIKKVVLESDQGTWSVLAANLKNLKWRQEVPPSSTGYQWRAHGFEEDIEDEIVGLKLSGLSETAVTVFKVDAVGVGRQISSRSLTSGIEYRVIIPPLLAMKSFPIGSGKSLDHGWQLWEFTTPEKFDGELTDIFQKLSLNKGKTEPRLNWVVTSPVEYMETHRGGVVPCFAAGEPLHISVQGITAVLPEEVHVFVLNGSRTVSFPLPSGNGWYFVLNDLVPGEGLVYVLHKRTTIGKAELPFRVVSKDTELISAGLKVEIKGRKKDPDSNGDILFKGDIGSLGANDGDFKIQAPPLWPVFTKWQDIKVINFAVQYCEQSGEYDTASVLENSKNLRAIQAPGNLEFDFSELGRVLLQHAPVPDPELIRKRFFDIVDTAGETLPSLIGQYQLLRQLWFDPILQTMGFDIEDLEQEELSQAPSGVTAFLVKKTKREKKSRKIVSKKDKVIVLVNAHETITISGKGSAREFADDLCDRHQVQMALITDGRYWMRHRSGSRLKARIYDLFELVKDIDSEEDFELFLSEVGGL